MTDELLDLACVLAEAFERLHEELVLLDEEGWPPLDEQEQQQETLDEHVAMKATLKRMIDAAPDPQRARAAAEAVYREEFEKAQLRPRMQHGSIVEQGTLRELTDIAEMIRRRRLASRALDDALRGREAV